MPIQNDLNGHFSYRLYNEQLFDLHKIIENINYNGSSDPDASYAGALWLDGDNLKYAGNNKWNPLYKDKFQITEFITSATQPENPIYGQLWIDRGILKYFDGSSFTTLKADTVQSQITDFDYYNYLIIHCLKEYGESYLNDVSDSTFYSKTVYKADWKYTGANNIYYYTILQTDHQLKNNFAYLLTSDILVGSGTYYKHELDDTEFQITTDATGNIIVYINDPKDITIDLIGVKSTSAIGNNTKVKTYLVPNAKNDRVFFDGLETEKHDYINDVTMTIDSSLINGQNISLAHVDPKYLSDIKKNIIYVSDSQPYINIKPEANNTWSEYYIYDMSDDKLKLLVKYEGTPDFVETPNGIMLTKSALSKYFTDTQKQSFVVVLTFCFKAFKTKGTVKKIVNTINDIDNGITVDTNVNYDNTYLIVDSEYTPNYSITDNHFEIVDFNGSHDVKLILCAKKTHITDIPHNDDNIIVLPSTLFDGFNKPMICFNGKMYSVEKFLTDDSSYMIEMDYHTIDYLDIIETSSNVVKTGIINNNCIECTYEDVGISDAYFVIIDNIAYDSKDIVRNKTNGSLYSKYIKNGLEYVIMLDNSDFIINENIASKKINIDRADDMLVYVNGEPVFNKTKINLSKANYNNQITCTDNTNYLYTVDGTEITISDNKLTETITKIINAFAYQNDSIEFNDRYVNQEYVLYSYTYGNIVEQPIITGEIDGSAGSEDGTYYLNDSDQYTVNANTLSIYINGIRQYPGTYTELNSISFKLDKPTDSIITYVIEPLEGTETQSYKYCITNNENKLAAYQNTYIVDNILANGYIKVYKNGARLNDFDFEIKSPNTIYIKDSVDSDVFLIESRNDYTLRENVMPIVFDKTIWNADIKYTSDLGTSYLPEEFIINHDTVLVYINGLLLGDRSCYEIDKINNTIELCDEAKLLLDSTQADNGYVTFEWR